MFFVSSLMYTIQIYGFAGGDALKRCEKVHLCQRFLLLTNCICVYSTAIRIKQNLLPTLIPLSGVGTTCGSSCCDKDSAIIFTIDVNPS
jgi:hypothetical protein